MNLREHDQRDDMNVWLSQDEVTALLDAADGTQERIALSLGARCGLRSHEVLDVAPDHVVDTDAGTMLRVHHGKGDKYRETPVPDTLASTIRGVGDYRDEPASEDVDPLLVCDWGGWNDLETFLDHYRGTFSPEAQQRARDGVAWL